MTEPLRLIDLEAHFLKHSDARSFKVVDSIEEADGVQFLCPACFLANDGRVGTHGVICWKPTVPQTTSPKPGRWDMVGTSLKDLTLVAKSSSVKLEGGCNAHFHVKAGRIEMC